MKDLFIIRGLPGSGKSTVAQYIAKAICTADDYYTDINGNYNWDVKNIKIAHEWCQRKCERFLKKNIPIVAVANTTTTEKELKTYYDLAEKYGYKVYSLIVENRHGENNIHNVPKETIKKMKNRFSIKL